jgi:hypothetical protein
VSEQPQSQRPDQPDPPEQPLDEVGQAAGEPGSGPGQEAPPEQPQQMDGSGPMEVTDDEA